MHAELTNTCYKPLLYWSVVELSFRKDRVHTVSMRALCVRIFTTGHKKRSFFVQKGTSTLVIICSVGTV